MRRPYTIVTFDEVQFSLMPKRGTVDAVFIFGRLQEEYNDKKKVVYIYIYICILWTLRKLLTEFR